MPESSFDPVRELSPANRHQIYAELRDQAPIYWSSAYSAWILTRYADVSAILRHPDALALDGISFLESFSQRGNLDLSSLIRFWSSVSLFTRGPHHDAVRRMLAHALGGIRRMNLPELLERRADLLLDGGERDGSIDLVAGYGKALALFVIGSFLGVPEEDLPELSRLAADLIIMFERTVPSVNTLIKLNKSAAASLEYFERLIDWRRRERRDDGISLMVELADKQLRCSDQELAGYCTFFFIAAEESTAAAISESALILLRRPELRAHLAGDPSRVPLAARELLRLVSPVQYVGRQMRVDFRVADRSIRAGQPIILMLGAANRDPADFPNPDEPRLDRSGPETLVFAAGPYRCIGAQLATFEVETAVRKLLQRPRIQLSPQVPAWTDRTNIAPLIRLQADFRNL
ncbi:MAG: cytochrome P450 [Bryobacteraceae bacterium]